MKPLVKIIVAAVLFAIVAAADELPGLPEEIRNARSALLQAFEKESKAIDRALVYLQVELGKDPGNMSLQGQVEAYHAKHWNAVKKHHEGLEALVNRVVGRLEKLLERAMQQNPDNSSVLELQKGIATLREILEGLRRQLEGSNDQDAELVRSRIRFIEGQIQDAENLLRMKIQSDQQHAERVDRIQKAIAKLRDEAQNYGKIAASARAIRDTKAARALDRFRDHDFEKVERAANRSALQFDSNK